MYDRALIVGKFAPLHSGHQRLLEAAMRHASRVTVLVYATPDFVWMPNETRAGWIRSIYPQLDVHIPENPPPDEADDFAHRDFVRRWLKQRGLTIEVVLSGEAYGPGFAAHIGATHIAVDRDQGGQFARGSQIRADVALHADSMHPIVRSSLGGLHGVDDLDKRYSS